MQNSTITAMQNDAGRYTSSKDTAERIVFNMKLSQWQSFVDKDGKLKWRDKNCPTNIVDQKPSL